MNMPPLPETEYGLAFWDEGGMGEVYGAGYTDDAMLAYGRACAKAAAEEMRERCAKVADLYASKTYCAVFIRELYIEGTG